MSISFTSKSQSYLVANSAGMFPAFSCSHWYNFSFDEHDEDFDLSKLESLPLSDFECQLLGGTKNGRDLNYPLSEDTGIRGAAIRRSTLEDWQIALQYLADLARALKQPITCETGETFTADTIQTFDFKPHTGGISMVPFEDEDEIQNYKFYGVTRPVALNKRFATKFSRHDPLAAFQPPDA